MMTKDDIKQYLQLVTDTLNQQQRYFRTRSTDELRKSRRMEDELRKKTVWMEEELGFRPKTPVQGNLFPNNQNPRP